MIVNDLERSMGNTELRLSLASLESEIVEVKSIALEVKEQALKTNGQVKWLTKMVYLAMGALAILAPISGWLATSHIADEKTIAALKAANTPTAITAAVNAGIEQAFRNSP